MEKTLAGLIVAMLLGVPPVAAQDWLDGLQELAKDLTAPSQTAPAPSPRPAPPKPPAPPVVAAPATPTVPPPMPLKRPDFDADPSARGPAEADLQTQAGPPPVDDDLPPGKVAVAEAARIYQGACSAVLQGLVQASMAEPIADGACGLQSPLVVTAVASGGRMIPLSSPVTTNCAMASALPDWVAQVDGYAQAMLDSPLAEIRTGPGYMCRLRNNGETGFVSEHGFANALDISGFALEDGQTIAVNTGWLPANGAQGRLLRLAHDAACGRFTTVLGPQANADHDDHLHLDLGCHGKSCTALICQ